MLIYAPADIDECIRSSLRFSVGDTVECNLGDGKWATEKSSHNITESLRGCTWWVPYQVALGDTSGHMVWAPQDTDDCIRAGNAQER